MKALLLIAAAPLVAIAERPGEWVKAEYQASDAPLTNPERGLYVELADRRQRPLEAERLDGLVADRITLVQRLYYLKGYRDRPLDAAQLDLIAADFATLREAGMKAILRFAYSSRIGEPDAPLEVVLGHIEQLTPLLRQNADLVLTVQAGFIGAWGEWHASTNGLAEPQAMRAIAGALLDALPAGTPIQLRTPLQKQRVLEERESLSRATLVRGAPAARIGHHNDCFLADETDVGTYRGRRLEQERAYVAADSRFVPVGGETCRDTPRSDPAFAREEMARMHWSFLNLAYHRGVIAKWRESGFLDEVRQRLGYRLRLVCVKLADQTPAGGVLRGELVLANDGWAAPINDRPLQLVLVPESGEAPLRLQIGADARDWYAGEEHAVPFALPLPGGAAPGACEVRLALPDASERLAADPRYHVRLANAAMPVTGGGEHDLGLTVRVIAAPKANEPLSE